MATASAATPIVTYCALRASAGQRQGSGGQVAPGPRRAVPLPHRAGPRAPRYREVGHRYGHSRRSGGDHPALREQVVHRTGDHGREGPSSAPAARAAAPTRRWKSLFPFNSTVEPCWCSGTSAPATLNATSAPAAQRPVVPPQAARLPSRQRSPHSSGPGLPQPPGQPGFVLFHNAPLTRAAPAA